MNKRLQAAFRVLSFPVAVVAFVIHSGIQDLKFYWSGLAARFKHDLAVLLHGVTEKTDDNDD